MLTKLFTLYVYFQALFCGCASDRKEAGFEKPPFKYKLERIGRLNEVIRESSGLATANDSTYWTHGDSGTPAELYRFNRGGEVLERLPLALQNQDWEELAEDKEHLYIGDFGNNQNSRQNLRIYRVNRQDYSLSGTIDFAFEDQTDFPSEKDNLHYDLEAFFHHQGSLYLFTKSRGKGKQLRQYVLPAMPGTYKAKLRQQLSVNSMVTAADLAPGGRQFAVLAYGRLYLFEAQNGEVNLSGKHYCLPLSRTGQAEALLFTSPNQLLLTNEGGKVYQLTLFK
ncbi:hypothetical protein CLV24_101163 [Pontibacter ummariensis]|uniref:SdiA-regulated n=1 Tax=Pontibacter ummariensis TaxID=1610492 RepID=A0A239B7E9_9BACT|nr:hypothetical protein [Pontibacter ummariensis]PRY16318.1 hypothetical protein CLV24_101163 [Pontibacter ummariensis]SNS03083.1 hypothetical protein SAMN06296052_101163 [Pontibacter ummariensis]